MNENNSADLQISTLRQALLQRLATEVRHTLHHALGSIELVLEETLSRQQARHLGRSRENLHEMLRIVNDVSELAEFDSPAEGPCLFEPALMLEEFSNLIRIRAIRKGLTLKWTVVRETPRIILGHRRVIESALYRLTDNSIRHAGPGEINVTLRWNGGAPSEGEVIVEVRDAGPGIGSEMIEDLKQPLSEMRHKGLGLRLVRKQMEAIGGRLEIVSPDLAGPVVAIVCPANVPHAGTTLETRPQEHSANSSLHLLVAEDSDDSFAIFEIFVMDEGHQVTRANNGAEAVDLFKTGCFDMVVMDIHMPVMDGYAATRKIREWETQEGRNRSPILLLSADRAAKQVSLGSSAGCSGYLTKPTPKRELLSALRHYAKSEAISL